MSVKELLETLQANGVELNPVGDDKLRYRAPSGVVTQEIKEALRSHKADLLVLLKYKGLDCLRCPASALWKKELHCFSYALFHPAKGGRPQPCETQFATCEHKNKLNELITRYRQ